jgi:DNA polymerase-3 subunit beta
VVPSSAPYQALTCFLVEANADDKQILVTGTNLETSIRYTIDAEVAESGDFLIDAPQLFHIAEKMTGEDMTFAFAEDDAQVRIESGTCVMQYAILPTKNFPKIEMPFPDDTFKICGVPALYAHTANATAAENTGNDQMKGIHLAFEAGAMRACACDGYRLAVAEERTDIQVSLNLTVPKTALRYLANAANDGDIFDIGVSGAYAVFMKPQFTLATRVKAGEYLDVAALLARIDDRFVARAALGALANAAAMLLPVARQAENTPPMRMQFVENTIILGITDVKTGAASEIKVPATVDQTMDEPFWYNPNHFADGLKTVETTDRSAEITLSSTANGQLLLSGGAARHMLIPCRKPREATPPVKPKKAKTKKTNADAGKKADAA